MTGFLNKAGHDLFSGTVEHRFSSLFFIFVVVSSVLMAIMWIRLLR